VLAVRDGVATRVDGHRPRRHRQVEITSGLAEGDQAILPASGALEGDKVRVRPPRKPKVGGLQVPQGMTK
jgi:HlyD family secretion protein